MKSEAKWMAVVVRGPERQHLLGIEPSDRKRDVWAKCLKFYQQAWREDPNDRTAREGYSRLQADWWSGKVRAVKVTISWENCR